MRLYQSQYVIACIFFIAFFFSPALNAHSIGEIDSLKQAYKNANTDTGKIKNLLWQSLATDCTDTANKIGAAKTALKFAENIRWNKEIIAADMVLGMTYGECTRNYPVSVIYFQKCSFLAKASGDTLNEILALIYTAKSYKSVGQYAKAIDCYREVLKLNIGPERKLAVLGNIGSIYAAIGDYPIALASYDSSLKVFDELMVAKKKHNWTDTLQLIGLNITVGDIYLTMSEYEGALKNYSIALRLCGQINNKTGAMYALTGLGKTYQAKGNDEDAIEYYNKALENLNDVVDLDNKMIIYNQLGKLYLEKEEVDEAVSYAENSLKLAQADPYNNQLPITYTLLGEIYTKEQKYEHAISCLEKAISSCKRTGALDNEKDALQALSLAYEQMKQPVKALETYKSFISIRDSVYSLDKAKQITRMEITSDFEAKQLADSLKQNQIRQALAQQKKLVDLKLQRQKAISIGSFAAVALMLLLAFFIYKNYQQQKKANNIINAEKQRAEQLRERAERSEQFKQQFLANMSHEIRTPMNAVSGMTDILLDKDPRPDQANYLQVISRSSGILLHIIDDILDLSKIEVGKLELETIDFSLSEVITQVRETLSFKAEEKCLQLIANIDDNVQDILLGDPYRLNQVLINLGNNAIKFTERGSVEINVTASQQNEDSSLLRFSVADTGIGIPAGKLPNLFENFKQLHNSDTRKYGGTGLGLAISKQLVELMGGDIIVESVEGSGTIFSFDLAYSTGSLKKLNERTLAEQTADGSELNGLRILLADDNEYNRLVVTETLRSKVNVTIDEATNGEEAIKLAEQNDYDIILMDVQMPVMNGFEATRYIRNKLQVPKSNVPVIAFTAGILRNDIELCREAGMNTYLSKPFKAWQLITTIAEQTGRKNVKKPAPGKPVVLFDATPVTDLTYLNQFCEGDMTRVKQYVNLFIDAVPAFVENVTNAIAVNDIKAIAVQLHSFKPKWTMMGMKECTMLGQKIEMLLQEQGNEQKITEALLLLSEQNKQAVSELKEVC